MDERDWPAERLEENCSGDFDALLAVLDAVMVLRSPTPSAFANSTLGVLHD